MLFIRLQFISRLNPNKLDVTCLHMQKKESDVMTCYILILCAFAHISAWLLFECALNFICWLGICFEFRAIRHPASGYVQGINDLATPFLVVFLSEHMEGEMEDWIVSKLSSTKLSNIEADCYWCLSKLLDNIHSQAFNALFSNSKSSFGVLTVCLCISLHCYVMNSKNIYWYNLFLSYKYSV